MSNLEEVITSAEEGGRIACDILNRATDQGVHPTARGIGLLRSIDRCVENSQEAYEASDEDNEEARLDFARTLANIHQAGTVIRKLTRGVLQEHNMEHILDQDIGGEGE
jgi:DNA-binding transcriptional LysR family regulator